MLFLINEQTIPGVCGIYKQHVNFMQTYIKRSHMPIVTGGVLI